MLMTVELWWLSNIFICIKKCVINDKLNKISKTYCTITCNDVLCIRFACVAQLVAQLIRNQ